MKRDAVRRALRPVSLRIRLCNIVSMLQIGLPVAAFAAFAWAVASFFTPIEALVRYALNSAAALMAAASVVGCARPVGARRAARAADALGLKERALTALYATDGGEMRALQREDALKRLEALDVRTGIRPRARRAELIAGLALFMATAVLLIVPNPQQEALSNMRAFEKKIKALTEAAEMRERPEMEAQEGRENPELRRIERELLDRLKKSRNEREALTALNVAEQKLNRIEKEASAGAYADDAAAGSSGSENTEGNDDESDTSASAGAQTAEASGSGSKGLSGEAANAQLGDMSSLISQLRQGVNKASANIGQNGGNGMDGSQGDKSGNGEGQGQMPGEEGGSGAGRGTTNLDAGAGAEMKNKNGSGESGAPEHRVGQYESIYDPSRLDGADAEVMAEGELNEGEISRVQLGPGEGQFDEDVPYDRVIGDYAQKAAKAAEDAALSPNVRQWVVKYFDSLID